MNPLLTQFLAEARDFLQGIGEKLMQLERTPGDADLMIELFRLVHTLKGNSGLFSFPDMTRVLHAGEDLMDAVRDGRVAYSQSLADQLLDAMDFVGMLCDEIESTGLIGASRATDSATLAQALRVLTGAPVSPLADPAADAAPAREAAGAVAPALAEIPEALRREACRLAGEGAVLHWVAYQPLEECFFQGDDPFHTVLQSPGALWGRIVARAPWPALAELDAYRCMLGFESLSSASRAELDEQYRYVPDQVSIVALTAADWRAIEPPAGASKGKARSKAKNKAANGAATATVSPEAEAETKADAAALAAVLEAQRRILLLDDKPAWLAGRLKAAASVLGHCGKALGDPSAPERIAAALALALQSASAAPLLAWLPGRPDAPPDVVPVAQAAPVAAAEATGEAPKFMRRADDAGSKSLKVDQAKIDLLMNLIGEMVVSKNALPYLAQRAEEQFGVRELAREIKAQYAVINRIAEEMQSAIMQVRMMPVSFVFQRFPRLVRDISRKLGKEVQLVLEGEETEADKNIIESLADPLIHIVRNSLDHGLETPALRLAAGKPALGTLTIRAIQQGDQVLIEIIDDGNGIDPAVIKRKAYEKGLIDEATLERISDREAVNLVFAPGFSTAEVVSDLSGRGVGMDVVRTAVEKVNGGIVLESEAGRGTRIRISLPLSMAVTQAMIVESDRQIFGVPMDHVVETVRIPISAVRSIKRSKTIVLRGKIIPLVALNTLLGLAAEPQANAYDEMAVLVTRVDGEAVGLIVDDFRETVEVIQKPLTGVLAGLAAYSGSALMGDGSVLMMLNIKEIL